MKRRAYKKGRGLLSLLCCVYVFGQPVVTVAQEESPQIAWGRDIYMTRCASCHGADGKGNGPAAAALKHQPADLTQISKNRGGTFPRDEIIRFIDGERPVPAHGPRHMPIWGEVFRRERADSEARMRIMSLVAFLQSLQEH